MPSTIFIGRLLKHPDYADKVRAMVLPAYAEIMRAIGARKGNVIERAEIEKLLQAAVALGIAGEKKITLWLHNWTSEIFDPPADYTLDWSPHFDRPTRKVPSPEAWNGNSFPNSKRLRKKSWRSGKNASSGFGASVLCLQASPWERFSPRWGLGI